jgi:hypothetical protein
VIIAARAPGEQPCWSGPRTGFSARTRRRAAPAHPTDLIVAGSLARVDLATANVKMEPAGKWLSFDTKLAPQESRNHHVLGLPAIDDDILHRILIRAAIFADDEHLAGRKLVKQIKG